MSVANVQERSECFTVTALDNGIPGYNRKVSYKGRFGCIPNERQLNLVRAAANLDISVLRVTKEY